LAIAASVVSAQASWIAASIYCQTQVEELLEAVRKEMDKAGAEIAEIFSATNSGVFLTTEADPA
jgi:hypothetical protein